jgi:hypothetical protein
MVHTIFDGVRFDDEKGSVIFTGSSENPILHALEYAEEANPYRSWEDTVSQFLPMLDRALIPKLKFYKE